MRHPVGFVPADLGRQEMTGPVRTAPEVDRHMHWFQRPDPLPLEELDPPQVADELATSSGVLVDVREAHEFRAGRAAAALHIPLGQLAGRAAELPRDRPIFLICATGNRSKVAARILLNAGFSRAVNVRGGTAAWMRHGLPMTR